MGRSSDVTALAQRVATSARRLARLDGRVRAGALIACADALRARKSVLLAANASDLLRAERSAVPAVMRERLVLSDAHVERLAAMLERVAGMPDPLGAIEDARILPDGVQVGRMRVPLGVVAMIFESRPAAAVEAIALSLFTGNGLVLRGGSEAAASNDAVVRVLAEAAESAGVPPDAFALVPSGDREDVRHLLALEQYIDVVIPRGGPGLIALVEDLAQMPVLRHGPGVCHVYVDEGADAEMAARIVFDGKVKNPSVCHATEAVLVHAAAAPEFWRACAPRLKEHRVEVRGDPRTRGLVPWAVDATAADWGREYLDLVLAARVVDSFEEALSHIERHGTRHTEVIVTRDLQRATRFQREVDASAVIVNGTTRLNEGVALGLGAQLGISTSRLHALGPMGLRELTLTKFVVLANGHVRD